MFSGEDDVEVIQDRIHGTLAVRSCQDSLFFFDRADCHSPSFTLLQQKPRIVRSRPLQFLPENSFQASKMSFLFGGGRPQLSSAEKIAAAETEVEMISDMFNRYFLTLVALFVPFSSL